MGGNHMSDMDWQQADETQNLRPHLPECEERGRKRVKHLVIPECICDALQACELRVEREQQEHLLFHRQEWVNDGLLSARGAVSMVQTRSGWLGFSPEYVKRKALGAIDALLIKENS
jgi:hypothetical protein